MRSRRFSLAIGLTAVGLLAIVGFAAFGNPTPTSEEVRVEAVAASIGHTAGAYAGVAFAFAPIDQSPQTVQAVDNFEVSESVSPSDTDKLTNAADTAEAENDTSEGTNASPTSGWLSEVEVRALVSLYFEPTDVNRAVRIAWCESRFDPNSLDRRTGGSGLFHHLPRYWDDRAASAGFAGADPTDAEASTAAAAWAVYNGGGWEIFACRG